MSTPSTPTSTPSTPTRQARAATSFVSPGEATGPRVPIFGTPGRSKFGSKSIIGLTPPSPSTSAASRAVSPSPSRVRGFTEDIKPSTSELGYASGLLRAGSATPSISPSESASNVGARSTTNIGASRSITSRVARRASVMPYSRARSVTRSPSPILPRVGQAPLFSSENENDEFDAMTCASTPIDVDGDDDNDDVQTLLAKRGGKSLPSDSPRSVATSSKPSSSVATENLPKFKPHPNGFDLTELRLLQDDLLLQLFSDRGNKDRLDEIRKEYGFNSVFELRKLMSEISRRGLDSNEGKFFTTSIEDPRRSYKKIVTNEPGNPFCID